MFGGEGAKPEKLTANLGQSWSMLDVWFKVYPICGWIQAVTQLFAEARGPQPLAPADVKHIQVGVSRYAAQNNGEPAPIDTMGAQYSIPYCAAVALLGNPRDPAWYQGEAITNPVTRALAKQVEIVIDPAIEAVYPAQFGASVKLTRTDGSVFKRTVLDCHGTPSDPCSVQEQMDKFRLLAGTRLRPESVTELAQLVDSAATLSSVREMTKPLRTGVASLVYKRERA